MLAMRKWVGTLVVLAATCLVAVVLLGICHKGPKGPQSETRSMRLTDSFEPIQNQTWLQLCCLLQLSVLAVSCWIGIRIILSRHKLSWLILDQSIVTNSLSLKHRRCCCWCVDRLMLKNSSWFTAWVILIHKLNVVTWSQEWWYLHVFSILPVCTMYREK